MVAEIINIKLDWIEKKLTTDQAAATADQKIAYISHFAEFHQPRELELKEAVIDCIDKAASLLADNIEDDSRYFIFEWGTANSTLTVVVTDEAKRNESKHVVTCHLSTARWESSTEEFAEIVRDWIHNYLTTCATFMQYSLIALFHSDTREKAKLL